IPAMPGMEMSSPSMSYKQIVLALALTCWFVQGLCAAAAPANEKQAAVELNNEAMKAKEKGDLESAIAKWEQALRLNPAYLFAKQNLQHAYNSKNRQGQGTPIPGLEQFHKRLGVEPDYSRPGEDPYVRAKFDEVSRALDPNYKPAPISVPPDTVRDR